MFYLLARIFKKIRFSAIKNSSIHWTSAIESGCQIVGSTMDRHSYCGYDCVITNATIGSFCSISDRVYIGGAAHPMHFVSTSPVFLSHKDSVKTKFSRHEYLPIRQTRIGNDVWIGYDAKILAGVNVGHGAVIGLSSVVTKDVLPYSVVAGAPARLVRMRFEADTVKALLESKWWDFADNRLTEAAKDFNDPMKFLKNEGLI